VQRRQLVFEVSHVFPPEAFLYTKGGEGETSKNNENVLMQVLESIDESLRYIA